MSRRHTSPYALDHVYGRARPFRSRSFLDATGTPVRIGACYWIKGLRETFGIVRVVRFHEPIDTSDGAARIAPDTVMVENGRDPFPVTAAGLEPMEPAQVAETS